MAAISFTKKEKEALALAANGYIDMMSNGENTALLVDKELENGLGSALYKLTQGAAQNPYKQYAKKRKVK